jgi:aminoglycoside phosphotransferase (APT) family kinase protein
VGAGLPADPMGRADPRVRVPRARTSLAAIADLWTPSPEVDELFARALELPPPEHSAVCHGDLHFRQLLVADGALTGVVDWVDLCRSDPGVDLSLAWGFLPPQARAEFLDEYGPVPEASALRARVLALDLMAILAEWARAESRPAVQAEALAGLARAALP